MNIRTFYNEEWKEFKLEYDSKFRYAISNYGRLASFTNKIEDGNLLKGAVVEGFPIFRYRIYTKEEKPSCKGILIHKLVAEHFLPPKEEQHLYMLHIDHNKTNNHFSNLKWATKAEWVEHNKSNPLVIAAKVKGRTHNGIGLKLTATKVQLIKKMLFDPNRKTRLKMIAKQFGVTEMTLHRIKTGENWGHIKI